jgi:tetratricopeptide (TPR) repeat protein
MLTLCLYVSYTEKPAIKRYLLVLFFFACGLMSKSMVVTLPVIMILLDYWPLKRFESIKGSLIIWQLREKISFFVLSAVVSVISIYTMYEPTLTYYSLGSRFANAPVSFVTYLEKTFWPHDMAVFYPYSNQLTVWQVMGSVLLITLISIAVIAMMKRMPYLFVGWLWYAITILPVIGIIQNGDYAMADRYHYLPSIGIAVMLTWGIPFLIKSEDMRKKILFPAGIAVLVILSVLTWRQCDYWKNSIELFTHAVQVTKNNYKAHSLLGHAYAANGQYQQAIDNFSEVIRLKANYKTDYLMAYSGRGIAYIYLKQYQRAIEDFSQAISLKPDYINPYNYRGKAYHELGQYKSAIEDYSTAIRLKPDYADAYHNRGLLYLNQGNKKLGCPDAQKACALGNCKLLDMAKGKGDCR